MLPQVFDQSLIHLFKYRHEDIQLGMQHSSDLYTPVCSYSWMSGCKPVGWVANLQKQVTQVVQPVRYGAPQFGCCDRPAPPLSKLQPVSIEPCPSPSLPEFI